MSELFITFFKIGLFTFGGGYAMISQIKEAVVEKKKWLSDDELMEIIRRLKAEGKTIILITHKLKEIKAVAERCTVLRRGKVIGTVDVKDVSENQLAKNKY